MASSCGNSFANAFLNKSEPAPIKYDENGDVIPPEDNTFKYIGMGLAGLLFIIIVIMIVKRYRSRKPKPLQPGGPTLQSSSVDKLPTTKYAIGEGPLSLEPVNFGTR